MESFEKKARAATGETDFSQRELAGVVVSARSKRSNYDNSFGFKGLSQESGSVDLESVFWIASCTKLMTTIAAMHLVEQGKVDLDEDIARIIPELKDPQILVSVDDGKPVLKPAKNKISLRQLLTHSAGMAYPFMSPKITAYIEATGQTAKMAAASTAEKYNWPLIYEPGEGFHYSQGIDFAGIVVERLSGMRLGEYMAKNVFGPVGVQQTGFNPSADAAMASNVVEMLMRAKPEDREMTATTLMNRKPEWDDMGGEGLFTNPPNYIKVLVSLTRNDGRILKKETVQQMFTPQFKDTTHLKEHIMKQPDESFVGQLTGALPGETDFNWGIGGLLLMEDVPGRRRKGSMSWSGLPCMFWWMDPASETAGCFGTNILPTGDVKSVALYKEFELAVYEELSRSKASRI